MLSMKKITSTGGTKSKHFDGILLGPVNEPAAKPSWLGFMAVVPQKWRAVRKD